MTKRKCEKRPTTLHRAVFGMLLWSCTIGFALDSAHSQPSVTKRNERAVVGTFAQPNVLTEEFSFLIKDFKIDQQGEINNLTLIISYRYKTNISNSEYPDFTAVAKDIEALLTNYPNKDDYWEILNKKITLMVLEKYPAIVRITSQIQVSPSPKNSYVRSSIATRERTRLRKH